MSLPKVFYFQPGRSRLACGVQVPTSFYCAHSHPAADPSDTALEPLTKSEVIFPLELRAKTWTVTVLPAYI
ncbi:MAG: hypothetical protein ACE5DO_04280 [Desulfobacterales bacterium]